MSIADVKKQILFLEQVEYLAKSGSSEDRDSLKDLFERASPRVNPCPQFEQIRRLILQDKNVPYNPDEITLLAKQGIDSLVTVLRR